MFFGQSKCTTKRTSGLSMPMPKATVATTTSSSSRKKRVLDLRALFRRETRVVGTCAGAGLAQRAGDLFDSLASQAVDDAGLALSRLDERSELRVGVRLLHDGVSDVRPVEPRGEDRGARQPKACTDVLERRVVGGRRERHDGDDREARPQLGQLHVLGAEVVAPLTDAVRLVDGEERDRQLHRAAAASNRA